MSTPETEQPIGSVLARHGWWVGFIGALAATIGDLIQLWTVNAARPALGLVAPPWWLVLPATVLGSLGLAVYGVGYWARVTLAPGGSPTLKNATLISGTALGVFGAAVHALTGVTIYNNVRGIAHDMHPLIGVLSSDPMVLSYWGIVVIAFFIATVGDLLLPPVRARWRWSNPMVVSVALIPASLVLGSPWPDFVIAASANIAHIPYFWRLRRS